MGRSLSTVVALGAFLLTLVFASHAQAAKVVYGVVPQDGALPTQDDLKLMPQGGISSIRTILSWATVENTQGTYDWSGTDEIVRQTSSNGITMFPFIYGTPAWAAAMDKRKCEGFECAVYPPKSAATRDAFTRFSVAAAKRYGPGGAFWTVPVNQQKQLTLQIVPCVPPLAPPLCDAPAPPPPSTPPGDPTPSPTPVPPTPTPSPLDPSQPPCQCTVAHPILTWQIWNEQNSPKYFAPKVDVANYAKMLKSAGNAIHAAVPNTDVILGGMWGPDTATKVVLPVRDYLTKLYKVKGIEKSFDSIALHPYSSSADGALDALKIAEKVINKSGDRKVGSWITEIGWASGGPKDEPFNKGKAGQGKILKQAFKGFKKKKGKYNLRGIYWYSWRDKPGGELICTWCGHAGLRAENGTAKPAWNAFVKAAKP